MITAANITPIGFWADCRNLIEKLIFKFDNIIGKLDNWQCFFCLSKLLQTNLGYRCCFDRLTITETVTDPVFL